MLTTERTGSTFFVRCLDLHPGNSCVSELLSGGLMDLPALMHRLRLVTQGVPYMISGGWCPGDLMNRISRKEDRPDQILKVMYHREVCRCLVKDFGTSKSPNSTRQRGSIRWDITDVARRNLPCGKPQASFRADRFSFPDSVLGSRSIQR
jgi:hypothetical protein